MSHVSVLDEEMKTAILGVSCTYFEIQLNSVY